jgi:hypothetical protein
VELGFGGFEVSHKQLLQVARLRNRSGSFKLVEHVAPDREISRFRGSGNLKTRVWKLPISEVPKCLGKFGPMVIARGHMGAEP